MSTINTTELDINKNRSSTNYSVQNVAYEIDKGLAINFKIRISKPGNSPMPSVSVREALSLYRELLRYGQTLKHTNREYFHRRLLEEFRAGKLLTEQTQIEKGLERARTALDRKALV